MVLVNEIHWMPNNSGSQVLKFPWDPSESLNKQLKTFVLHLWFYPIDNKITGGMNPSGLEALKIAKEYADAVGAEFKIYWRIPDCYIPQKYLTAEQISTFLQNSIIQVNKFLQTNKYPDISGILLVDEVAYYEPKSLLTSIFAHLKEYITALSNLILSLIGIKNKITVPPPFKIVHATYLLNLIKCTWNNQFFGKYNIIFAESRGAEFSGEYKRVDIIKNIDPTTLTERKFNYPDLSNVGDFCWADSYEPYANNNAYPEWTSPPVEGIVQYAKDLASWYEINGLQDQKQVIPVFAGKGGNVRAIVEESSGDTLLNAVKELNHTSFAFYGAPV